jgi:hypothetical protein
MPVSERLLEIAQRKKGDPFAGRPACHKGELLVCVSGSVESARARLQRHAQSHGVHELPVAEVAGVAEHLVLNH